jgi:hypothetical protein
MNFVIMPNQIELYCRGGSFTVYNSDDSFDTIKRILKNHYSEDAEDKIEEWIYDLLDKSKKVSKYFDKAGIPITIENGLIKYKGYVLKSSIVDRIQAIENAGGNPQSLISFIERLSKNPSPTSINELYLFLEYNKLPIIEKGTFLAYKRIRENWKDIYSDTIDNSPGAVIPEMKRDAVDPNRNNVCSTGYHVCGYDYLDHFGSSCKSSDRVILVEVDPADVVTVPADYNNAKMRVTYYRVIEEIENWRKTKVRDYFVFDTDRYESWEEYHSSNANYKEIDVSDSDEDFFKEDEEFDTDEDLFVEEESDYDFIEDYNTDNMSAEEFLFSFLPYRGVAYSVAGRKYAGFVLCDICPGKDAREEWNRIKKDGSEIFHSFLEKYEYESSIKRAVSDKPRKLVVVTRIDGEELNRVRICAPLANSVREY